MKSKSFSTGFAALAAGLIFVTGGGAATTKTTTLTVSSTTDGTGVCTVVVGTNKVHCPSLRSAINFANTQGQSTDNSVYLIKLAAKTYHLNLGTLDVSAASANTGNIVEIAGATSGKKHLPASVIDGSGNPKPSSVFIIDSPTQMGNVVVTGGTGNGNYVCYSSSAGCGGGFFVDSALDLENSVVRNNKACSAWTGNTCTGTWVYGGGIYVPDSTHQVVTLYRTSVTHNVAYGGGGISNDGVPATLLIMWSHIDHNTACSSFTNGVCTAYGFGGGIDQEGEQITLNHSTVNGNVAGNPAYSTGDGGGIYSDNDNMQLNHTTVNRNVAGSEGGGLYDDENIDFVSSTVSHNIAGVYGGGMYLDYLASFDKTTFSGNTAGGTFECTTAAKTTCQHTIAATTGTCATLYPSATQCTSSDGYGGGIYSDEEYPELVASTVTNNLAASIKGDATDCGGGQGGGIYTYWTLTAVDGTKVTNNTADCGGGIYNEYGGSNSTNTFALADSLIAGNTALEDGGGIWTQGSASLTLYGMHIVKNHAGRQTGGVWDDQVGSVLFGPGNLIFANSSKGACKNITLPCN